MDSKLIFYQWLTINEKREKCAVCFSADTSVRFTSVLISLCMPLAVLFFTVIPPHFYHTTDFKCNLAMDCF